MINLDSKAHDGFAANLASVLTDHSLDEKILNFEDAIGSTDADRIYGTAGANQPFRRFRQRSSSMGLPAMTCSTAVSATITSMAAPAAMS